MTFLHTPTVEIRLAHDPNVWLSTIRADGSIHTTPVWFVYEDDTWWIASGDQSVKVRNLLIDPRVSLALQDGDAPVVAEGAAQVHRENFPPRVRRSFATKYAGWDITDPAQPGGQRILIEVPVSRWLLTGFAG